jgi:site-specific recombinase XerC
VSITAKGGKRRVLPTTGDVDELLAAAAQCATHPSDPAIAALHGRSLSRPALDAAWWRLKQKAGINPALRLHDLRRTTATNLYRITHDLRAVQEYLGHDALASTTHYLAPLGEQRLRELHQLLKFQSEVKQ